MDASLINHILLYSGVTVSDCPEEYEGLYKKLSDYFITPENEQWFNDKNSGCCPKPKYSFWELFSYGVLNAAEGGEAIKLFEELNISECRLLQPPEYILHSNQEPAYLLKGEYDVSLLDDGDRASSFKSLKEFIRRDVTIPFWVIDGVSSAIGKELYAFDDSMTWVLVLTHENQTYLYKSCGE